MPVAAAPRVTPEEFALLPDAERFELIDGELVEREMSNRTTKIGGAIYTKLDVWSEGPQRGCALPDGTMYRCFPDQPDRIRKPDASWFSAERWSPARFDATYLDAAPDLIVEVLSPNDIAYDVSAKVDEFFAAGAKEAWIVHPHTRQLERRYADLTARWFAAEETLDGGPLLPGFALRLADILDRVG